MGKLAMPRGKFGPPEKYKVPEERARAKNSFKSGVKAGFKPKSGEEIDQKPVKAMKSVLPTSMVK